MFGKLELLATSPPAARAAGTTTVAPPTLPSRDRRRQHGLDRLLPRQRHPRDPTLRSLRGLNVILVDALGLAEVLQGFPDQRQAEAGRRTIDLLIGTFCLERGHALLHHDRDFDPMADRPGLQTV